MFKTKLEEEISRQNTRKLGEIVKVGHSAVFV